MLPGMVVLAVLAITAGAQAQDSEEVATRDTSATFSARVNLVMVPVVVRNKDGRAVGNLTKENFLLFDRGKPQLITRFQVERESDRMKPVEVASDTEADKTVEAPKGAIIPSRFLAFVFDDLHLQTGDLVQARSAARVFLAESLRPDERVAVYTTSGKVMLDFTDDVAKVIEAMNRIMPQINTSQYDCPPMTFYEGDMIENKHDPITTRMAVGDAMVCGRFDSTQVPMAQQMVRSAAARAVSMSEQDSHVELGVLKDIARRMSAAPGERTMVLISSGYYLTDFERSEQADVIDRAIRSNVTISVVDARGLYTIGGDASNSYTMRAETGPSANARSVMQHVEQTVMGDAMAELADGTGGILFHNSNDLADGFRRTTAPPEFIYLLGFSPQNLKIDGSYHALKVSLNVKGLTLVARRGYYAPRHQADEAELIHEEIGEALFSREEIQDIPVHVQTQFFKTDAEKARLAVIARIDLKPLHFRKEEGRNKDTLVVVAGIFDRNGNLVTSIEKTIEMRLRDETFPAYMNRGLVVKSSLDMTPGSYAIRLVVRDQEGKMLSARNSVVEIPF